MPTIKTIDLNTPCVYRFVDENGRTLYVGMSRYGIGRATSREHRQIAIRKICQTIEYEPCSSIKEAQRLEQEWIDRYKPPCNVVGNSKHFDPWFRSRITKSAKILSRQSQEAVGVGHFLPKLTT